MVFKKGLIPWNKGKSSWNKGLTKETDERVMKYSKLNHYNYGKHRSEEIRRKISTTKKSRPSPSWNKGLTKEMDKRIMKYSKLLIGKHHSEETKEKLRQYKREKSSGWLGGISFEPYTIDFNKRFKENIKERDFNCCQLCNISKEDLLLLKRYLIIHHIDYNKLNSFPQNCISLCKGCHAKTNINRTQWTTFFQSLLKERYGYQYTQDQKIILDFMTMKDN